MERSAYFEGARSAPFFLSPLNQPYNDDGTINQFSGSLPNPLFITRENIDDNRFTRILSNNALNWNLSENISVGSKVSIDYQIYNYRTYSNTEYGYGAATSGDASQYTRNNVFYVVQNYIDYGLDIAESHRLDFKLLQEYQQNRRYFLGAEGENFPDSGLVNLDNLGTPTSISSQFLDQYFASYLGLASYKALDSRYVLNLSIRREGSSLFSKNNRWGNFWSVGGAWNIDKESFMDNFNIVDNLKLRASYGTTGNSSIDFNEYQALFSYSTDYGGEGAQQVDTFGNNDLSWEKSSTLDIGLDFGLFDGVLSGSIGYFSRETTDLLLDVPLSLTTGFSSQVQNIGEVTNSGIEIDLNANIINTPKLKLSIGGNLGTVNNEVTKLALDPNGIERTITTTTTKIESGHPIREWFMPTWAGVNPETGNEEWYINGLDGATTTVFNDAEAVYQGGNSVPKLTAGLNFNFNFVGIFINAKGYYAGGHKIYEGWHRYTNQTNGFPIVAFQGLTSLLNRWQQPGDIARNGKFTTAFTPWQRHSKYLYEGDYIRLRTLTLGYDFQNKFEKFGISNLKLYLRGNNLLTWTKDKNLEYDPEVDLDGETGLETPPTKSLSFGITLNF